MNLEKSDKKGISGNGDFGNIGFETKPIIGDIVIISTTIRCGMGCAKARWHGHIPAFIGLLEMVCTCLIGEVA